MLTESDGKKHKSRSACLWRSIIPENLVTLSFVVSKKKGGQNLISKIWKLDMYIYEQKRIFENEIVNQKYILRDTFPECPTMI